MDRLWKSVDLKTWIGLKNLLCFISFSWFSSDTLGWVFCFYTPLRSVWLFGFSHVAQLIKLALAELPEWPRERTVETNETTVTAKTFWVHDVCFSSSLQLRSMMSAAEAHEYPNREISTWIHFGIRKTPTSSHRFTPVFFRLTSLCDFCILLRPLWLWDLEDPACRPELHQVTCMTDRIYCLIYIFYMILYAFSEEKNLLERLREPTAQSAELPARGRR